MTFRNFVLALAAGLAALVSLSSYSTAPSLPASEDAWKRLASSAWIGDGRADAARIVYAFIDPSCPFCGRFWQDARPWVDSGKVQVRHVLVGILSESSTAKAAAVLGAEDPSAELRRHELGRAKGGVRPAAVIAPDIAAKLQANEALLHALAGYATPTIVYRDARGAVRRVVGAPSPAMLTDVLGPR